MNDLLVRLKRCLSYSEVKAMSHVLKSINFQSGIFISSKMADDVKITRSVFVNVLCKLEIAGLIETRSLGMKGTHIKIIDEVTLGKLVEELS